MSPLSGAEAHPLNDQIQPAMELEAGKPHIISVESGPVRVFTTRIDEKVAGLNPNNQDLLSSQAYRNWHAQEIGLH